MIVRTPSFQGENKSQTTKLVTNHKTLWRRGLCIWNMNHSIFVRLNPQIKAHFLPWLVQPNRGRDFLHLLDFTYQPICTSMLLIIDPPRTLNPMVPKLLVYPIHTFMDPVLSPAPPSQSLICTSFFFPHCVLLRISSIPCSMLLKYFFVNTSYINKWIFTKLINII